MSFYNDSYVKGYHLGESCHTHPNDELLQRRNLQDSIEHAFCCHTHPNDELLQPRMDCDSRQKDSCHTHPNDELLQQPFLSDLEEIV